MRSLTEQCSSSAADSLLYFRFSTSKPGSFLKGKTFTMAHKRGIQTPEFPCVPPLSNSAHKHRKPPQFLRVPSRWHIQMTACVQLHKHLFSDTILTLVRSQLYTHQWKAHLVYRGVVWDVFPFHSLTVGPCEECVRLRREEYVFYFFVMYAKSNVLMCVMNGGDTVVLPSLWMGGIHGFSELLFSYKRRNSDISELSHPIMWPLIDSSQPAQSPDMIRDKRTGKMKLLNMLVS